ncbi:MAG: LLM class F420-dependent oxidoreductase [Acidimicrobiia bacterium]|nr:LLM class F420-dependent oxidoreductase [Acidimicrobiia bacterium]
MKFGMLFANVGPFGRPEHAAALGAICEETGIESVWTVEHVVVPGGYASEYPYSRDGKMPGGDTAPIPDPLMWLTWVGAHTTTLRLATGILILPQRNPVVLAKEVATLDVLSGGRVTLGIGVGWLEEEFDALGIPFGERAARTDECVAVMRALWAGEAVDFDGSFTTLRGANSFPHPAQTTVPIVVGGHTKAAARRAGRLGDGFFPGKGDWSELQPVMRAAAEEAGRDPDAIEITRGGAMDVDGIKRMCDEGCDRLVIPPLSFDPDGLRDALARFADDVISNLT